MKKKLFNYLLFVILFSFINQGLAAQGLGLGQVAKNMLEPVGLLSDFVNSACFIIGGSFLFASLIKYVEHRKSPLMVPISTVIFLLIGGITLILLPFLAFISESGVKYSILQ